MIHLQKKVIIILIILLMGGSFFFLFSPVSAIGYDEATMDSDQDGLFDFEEISIYFTDPYSNDTDIDGFSDLEEILQKSDPLDWNDPVIIDSDLDGIQDGKEYAIYLTDFNNPDSDDDGYLDGWEIESGWDPLDYNSPTIRDTDLDGLGDDYEVKLGLNPNLTDSDGDGFGDGTELECDSDPLDWNSPVVIDQDEDLILDEEEKTKYHTNPASNDTDGDKISDYDEIFIYGLNPLEDEGFANNSLVTVNIFFTKDYTKVQLPLTILMREFSYLNGICARIPDGFQSVLKKDSRIKSIDLDKKGSDKPFSDDLDWGVDYINAERVWGMEENDDDITDCRPAGQTVKVAIMGKGLDWDHDDLVDAYSGWYNANNGSTDPFSDYTRTFHETECAGIIAAADDEWGIIGVSPKIKFYALNYFYWNNSCSDSSRWAAFDWAVDNDIDVLSWSYGWDELKDLVYDKLVNLTDHGVTVVVPTGNNYSDEVCWPARYSDIPGVIGVGSIDDDGERAPSSQYGDGCDLVAPGVDIETTIPNNYHNERSGTSYAVPHVAGVVALMLSVNPHLTPADISQILNDTATQLPDYEYDEDGWNEETGHGCVNALEAVNVAELYPKEGEDTSGEYSFQKVQHNLVYEGDSGYSYYGIYEHIDYDVFLLATRVYTYLYTRVLCHFVKVNWQTWRIDQGDIWMTTPYNMIQWTGDYDFDPSTAWNYEIGSGANAIDCNLRYGQDSDSVTESDVTRFTSENRWIDHGYLLTDDGGGQEYDCLLKLKVDNEKVDHWVGGHSNQGWPEETMYYLLQIQMKVKVVFQYWVAGWQTSDTHTHIFGDGIGTYDNVDIEVSSGTSPV